MHSKQKGTLAETKVVADLYNKGFSVASVVDDLLPFDLICIDSKYNLYKIQVKYCRLKNGVITLPLRRCMSNKTLQYTRYYTIQEVDVFAIYCPDIDECLYIKSDILESFKNVFIIRVNKSLNNNKKRSHFREDFLNFPVDPIC